MLTKLMNLICFVSILVGLSGYPGSATDFLLLLTASIITLMISWKLDLLPARLLIKYNSVYYLFWLTREIIFSSIAVIKIAWRKNLNIHPIMKPVKSIQRSELGMIIYANSITLTPGTVTLSIHDDNLMVHALDVGMIEGLEEGKMDQMVSKIVG